MTLNSGTIIANADNTLGTGTITVAGNATLSGTDLTFFDFDNNITINSGVTLSAEDIELNGDISGDGSLFILPTNNVTLAGNNTFTGGTTLQSTNIDVESSTAFGTGTVTVIGTGASISTSGNLTFANNFVASGVTGSNLNFQQGSNSDLILSGNISGSSQLSLNTGSDSDNTVTLTGTNTHTGGTRLFFRTNVIAGNSSVFGTGTLIADGEATLQTSVADLIFTNNVFLDTNNSLTLTGSNDFELSGVISGAGDLATSGTATYTISGNNTYTGGTTLGGGEVLFGTSSAFSNSDIEVTASTTIEPVSANLTVANNIEIASSQTFSVDSSGSRPFTLSGVISGDGAFAAQNAATFTFSGANTYTGGTTLTNAEIFIGNDSAFGTGDITITSLSDFSATVDGINVANNIDLDNSAGLSLEGENNITLSGNITGTTGSVR